MLNAAHITKVENGFTIRVDSTKLRTGSEWDTLDRTFVISGDDIKKVSRLLNQLWEEGDDSWEDQTGRPAHAPEIVVHT